MSAWFFILFNVVKIDERGAGKEFLCH